MSTPEQSRSDQGKFMQVYDEPLADTMKGTRFPVSIDSVLAEVPNRSDFFREAVINKLKEDGWLNGDSSIEQESTLEQSRSDQGKFMRVYDEPLAVSPRGARFPVSIDAVLAEVPNRMQFLREAVIVKLKEDGWLKDEEVSN